MTAPQMQRKSKIHFFFIDDCFISSFSRFILIYDLLNVTFMIDEELTAWKEVHDWIRAMTFPVNFDEYKNLRNLNPNRAQLKPQYSDAKIVVLSSSNNPTHEFVFYDVFPTTISTIILSTQEDPNSIPTADASFRYSYYDIKTV